MLRLERSFAIRCRFVRSADGASVTLAEMKKVLHSIALACDESSVDFRRAMRHLVGGVNIITVGRGRDITGMTVTSVASLSVDPPSLIVSINRSASSWPLLKRDGFFGVNILNADQIDLAERFAGKGGVTGADRFASAEWITRVSGAPLLADALAAIDCEVEHIVERHSHAIVIGRPLDIQLSQQTAALAYWQGQYVATDRSEDEARLAEFGLAAAFAPRKG
jgi:flavin reductase (DIM6/NTAB) family NADH-FMN oxidoreductase RutF